MSSKLPKISIITPSYNQGQFIEQTIKSVIEQDYPNLEYIVMDGGSTDNTLTILKKYSNKLKWFSAKDKGQADAINKGMEMATGDILAYINSDDYYLPGAFKKVVSFFKQNPEFKWVVGDYLIVDERNKQIQQPIIAYKRFWRSLFPTRSLYVLNYIPQPSTFWRKQIRSEIGKFNLNLHYVMDYDFWLRIISKYPLGRISGPLSAFRIHRQSKGGVNYSQQFAEELKVMKKYTNNKLLVGLHVIHNWLINGVYSLIK